MPWPAAAHIAASNAAPRQWPEVLPEDLWLDRSIIDHLAHGFPSPILCQADAEQPRIGDEHIGRQRGIVGVQECAGDSRDIENVLDISHGLPAVLVGENQRHIHVGIPVELIVGLVIEDAGEGIALPIEIPAQRRCPTGIDRHRILRACG